MAPLDLMRSLAAFPASAADQGLGLVTETHLRMRAELLLDGRHSDPIALVDHDGDGDASTALYFGAYLQMLQAHGARRMILDLSRTRVSNETHLGMLVNIADACDRSPITGPLVLCSVPPSLLVVFEMLGLQARLTLAPDRAEALARHGHRPAPLSPLLEQLLERSAGDRRATRVALDALREQGHAIAGLLDEPQLRLESIRRGPVRVPDAPKARLIVPLGQRHEAVLALAGS